MARFLPKSMRWSLEVSRSTKRLSINFHATIPRHRFSTTHTFTKPLSPKSSRSRQTQRFSFSSGSKYFWPEAELPRQTRSNTETPEGLADLTEGFNDAPALQDPLKQHNWATSFHGLSSEPFAKEVTDVLLAPIVEGDVEVKPDGILYLPEIKYRRILNRAFGPGGWGLAPRGETIVTPKVVTREYALVALGRLISIARGEQDYFSADGIPTAAEGCKSNALTRCCKDLGIASELWDPRFIRKFLADHVKEIWAEHVVTKKKKKLYIRKDDKIGYPWKESRMPNSTA